MRCAARAHARRSVGLGPLGAYPPRYVERRLGVAQEVALAAEAAALVVAHPTLCSGAGVQLVQLVRVRVRVGVGVRVRVRVSRG